MKTENYLGLKCLSIKQPYAWLIANGLKDIENRDWPARYRGDFLIHAGKVPDKSAYDWIKQEFGIDIPENLPLGGIVGKATITDCVTKSDSPWFFGKYGFVIKNARPLEFYPCRGQLYFFKTGEQ